MPAAAPRRCRWKTFDIDKWRDVVNVNLTGPFLCTQEAFRIMKDQTPMGGRIINNGSISAHVPRPNSAPYTSTKHGLTGLTKATALDGRKYDIACGQIDIGNALTSMTGRMGSGVPQAGGSVRQEPTMDIDNVTRAVLYMAGLPLDANVLFPHRHGDQDAVCRSGITRYFATQDSHRRQATSGTSLLDSDHFTGRRLVDRVDCRGSRGKCPGAHQG